MSRISWLDSFQSYFTQQPKYKYPERDPRFCRLNRLVEASQALLDDPAFTLYDQYHANRARECLVEFKKLNSLYMEAIWGSNFALNSYEENQRDLESAREAAVAGYAVLDHIQVCALSLRLSSLYRETQSNSYSRRLSGRRKRPRSSNKAMPSPSLFLSCLCAPLVLVCCRSLARNESL